MPLNKILHLAESLSAKDRAKLVAALSKGRVQAKRTPAPKARGTDPVGTLIKRLSWQ